MQLQPNKISQLLHGGRLFQKFMCDAYACVELNNLRWIQNNQKQLQLEHYKGLMDQSQDIVNEIGQ